VATLCVIVELHANTEKQEGQLGVGNSSRGSRERERESEAAQSKQKQAVTETAGSDVRADGWMDRQQAAK
jgi:hypothetical protein